MSAQWLQCKEDTKVLYLWWYDTAAILDEYDDSEEGILPKGELVRISTDVTYEGKVALDLKYHKRLMRSQLPKGRVHKIFLLCTPTPLTAVISKDVFESNFGAGLIVEGEEMHLVFEFLQISWSSLTLSSEFSRVSQSPGSVNKT